MDYIQQAFKVEHDWWRYLAGCVLIFIAWQVIGMMPLMIALGIEIMNGASMSVLTDIPQIASLLGKNLFLFLMLISFAVGLLGVIFSAKLLHKQSFLSLTTARPKIDWKRFWFVFVLWGMFSVGSTLLSFYLSPNDYVVNFNFDAFLTLAIIVIIFLPLQTSFEEYLFRGYLMQGLGVLLKNRWVPLLLTSIGFGLLHGLNPEVARFGPIMMVFYIGTGLVLGIMTLMDDGMEMALGFHAANNMFAALMITSDWSALQTDAVLKYIVDPENIGFAEIGGPVIIVYPILIFILAKVYKWKHWKAKLFGPVEQPPKDNYKILENHDATF